MIEPRKWWIGALALVPIWLLANLFTTTAVEGDLAGKANAAIPSDTFDHGSVQVAGRDITLGGAAFDETKLNDAALAVLAATGVRQVDIASPPLASAKPYIFSAKIADGKVTLTGNVPDPATRAALMAATKSSNPAATVTDQLTYAAGAPSGFVAMADKSVAALADFASGSAVLQDKAYSIEGIAYSAPAYDHAASAIKTLPEGMTLAKSAITPPKVAEFVFSAEKSAGSLTLSGDVPGAEAHATVVAAAKSGAPSLALTDNLEVASGLPPRLDYAAASSFALNEVALLKSGKAGFAGSEFSISGEAELSANAARIASATSAVLPGGLILKKAEIVDQEAIATAASKAVADKAMADKAIAEKAVADKLAADKIAADQIAADKLAADKVAADKLQTDKMAADKATADKASADKLEADKMAAAKVAADKVAADKVAADKVAADQASADKSAAALAAAKVVAALPAPAASDIPKPEIAACKAAFEALLQNDKVHFAAAKANILANSYPLLDQIIKNSNECKDAHITVVGYTDADGNTQANILLSQSRAKSVVEYLTRGGVDASRLQAQGFGAANPVAANDTPENKAKNRRIEFNVIN